MVAHDKHGLASDDGLLREACSGCTDCFAILFHRYCRGVFSIANRILRDQREAEDILQEDAQGVTYIEKAKLPAILYMHAGNEEYLRYALAAQKRIFDHHMLIDGIPSTTEDYRGVTALDSHETCDISDHTWTWGYLLMATGDGVWADRIERAVFNAGFGAIKKDWRAHQYFSCPNQFLATQNSCHAVLAHGKGWMSYRPGHTVACCSGNVHRIFPNYAIRMWMHDRDGGRTTALELSTVHWSILCRSKKNGRRL